MLKKLLLLIGCAIPLTAAHALPISGKVVGPDDKPVAGAQVVVTHGYDSDNPNITTDAAGVFKLELEPVATSANNFGRATVYAPPLALGGVTLKPGENVIKLERAAAIQGIVQDRAGQPVANAIIKVQFFGFLREIGDGGSNVNYVALPTALNNKFTTRTGADGHWSITGLPVSRVAMVLMDDSRFAQVQAEVKSGAAPAASRFIAQPGATATGRVVHADGTSAGSIQIHGYGEHCSAQAVTAADGTYTLTSLAAEAVTVAAHDPTGQFVAPTVSGVQTKAGETVTAPDLTLTKGALLAGQVTDKAAGTPLPDVAVTAYVTEPDGSQTPAGGAWHPISTDKDGRFQFRVLPGKVGISIWQSPGQYLPLIKPVELDIRAGETKSVALQLVKGLTVSGVATQADGKLAANAEFELILYPMAVTNEGATHTYRPPVTATADGNGKWTVEGLEPGQWKFKGKGDWEVVSPPQVTLPLATTVQVIVRPIQWQTLKGRVFTKDHKPVAGASIKANLEIPEGANSFHSGADETLTDAQGQYTFEKLRPDTKVSISTMMPGYKYVTGGKVTAEEAGLTAQDLILAPLTSKLEGRVVDTLGQPIAGAQIMSPDGDLKAPATSDAEGHFTLTGLPEEKIMVVGGFKNMIGEARDVQVHQPLRLTLSPVKPPPPHDTPRAYEILDDLWAVAEGGGYYRSRIPAVLAPFAPDLALKMATKPDGSISDEVLYRIIIDGSHADPAHAVQWAPPYLGQFKNADQAIFTKMLFALAIAKVKPDLALDYYHQGKAYCDVQLAQGANNQQAVLLRAILLAPLAHKLGLDAEAQPFIQAAIAMVKTNKEVWILPPLAALEYDETAKMIDEVEATRRSQILREAVNESRKYDLKLAQRWLVKLIELEKQNSRAARYAGTATQSLVTALGKTDPAGALALARLAPSQDKLVTLALAAQFQTTEVALPLLHEAADAVAERNGTVDIIARIAAQAYDLDPTFGLALFAKAKEQEESAQARNEAFDSYGYDNSLAAFAFYYSRVDPAACRLMLETEFARDLRQPVNGLNYSWQSGMSMRAIALAMAAVDVERALELSLMIPPSDPNGGDTAQFETQRGIAQYLLLSDTERRAKPFQEWSVVDEMY